MSGGDRREKSSPTAESGASRARLGRLADELAAQEELLEQLLAHLTDRGARIGALNGALGDDQAGAREIRGMVARQRAALSRSGEGVLTALRTRREQLDRLRSELVSQREEVGMLAQAVRDSGQLERSLRQELLRR